MYILQDCPVCFEDYGSERIPHSITCGHVFCRPCLESLLSSSSNCPNCRAAIGRKAIRKVVCAFQDPPEPGPSPPSEAETIMWAAISSALSSMDMVKQPSLIMEGELGSPTDNFSENLQVALHLLEQFLHVKSTNHGLKEHLETSRALETSLRDQITSLMSKLEETQTLLSDIKEIKSSVSTIAKATTQIARHQRLNDLVPKTTILNTPLARNPTPIPSNTNQAIAPLHPKPTSAPPRAASFIKPQPQRSPSVPGTPTELGRPSTQLPSRAPAFGLRPVSPQTSFWSNFQTMFWSNQAEHHIGQGLGSTPLKLRPSPSKSKPISRPATAACEHTASEFGGLALHAGEKLEIIDVLEDLRDGDYLVLCCARGEIGYVPRKCLELGDKEFEDRAWQV